MRGCFGVRLGSLSVKVHRLGQDMQAIRRGSEKRETFLGRNTGGGKAGREVVVPELFKKGGGSSVYPGSYVDAIVVRSRRCTFSDQNPFGSKSVSDENPFQVRSIRSCAIPTTGRWARAPPPFISFGGLSNRPPFGESGLAGRAFD